MGWNKHFYLPFERYLYLASTSLFLLSFYFGSRWLFFIAAILCIANAFSRFYLKTIAKCLWLENPKIIRRLFVNETDTFPLTLQNRSRWPVFFASVSFRLENVVLSTNVQGDEPERKQTHYTYPLIFYGRAAGEQTVRIKGLQRGVARVSAIHMTVRDWFGLGQLQLSYDAFFHTSVVVYPEFEVVYGLERMKTRWRGDSPFEFSLDEDLRSPTGTRDYVRSDAFNRIHWKASAKTGQLQTKVFQKTTGMIWVLIYNLDRARTSEEMFERDLRCLVSICKYAAAQPIPFEIYTNIKTRGRGEILHLFAGEGRKQLARALELLARISIYSVTVSVEWMLAYINRQNYQNPVFILCRVGHIDDRQAVLTAWRHRHFSLYHLQHYEAGAFVTKFTAIEGVP